VNDFNKDLYFFGFSKWGVHLIKDFFKPNRIVICKTLSDAIKNNIDHKSIILMYPTKKDKEVLDFANKNDIKVAFIEDAFIRSLTLGSSFFKPASLVVDYKGIYYDPFQESDLEFILNNYNFTAENITRASQLITLILDMNISKYNHLQEKEIPHSQEKKNILVIGQVDDDMSIKKGGFGLDSFKLLETVKANNNDAFIIYKPHPDVVAGIRNGNLDINVLKQYANEVVLDSSLNSCFKIADEVHTITSLSGFEALMRNKIVFTYGMPFYAGWGLTTDIQKCDRRRRISLEELVYASYILYPRYVSLVDKQFCEVEQTIHEIVQLKQKYFNNYLFRIKTNFMGKMGIVLRDIYHLIKR